MDKLDLDYKTSIMGCALDTYRCTIGNFVSVLHKILLRKASVAAGRVRGLTLNSKTARLLAASCLMTLLVIGNVERNPGPLHSSSPSSSSTEGDNAGVGLQMWQKTAETMQRIEQRIEDGQRKMDQRLCTIEASLSTKLGQLCDEQEMLRGDVNELAGRQDRVEEGQAVLREQVAEMTARLEALDMDSRKCNLIFFGVVKRVGVSCQQLVMDVLRDQLRVQGDPGIEYARWAGSAIVVRFESLKHRARVLAQARQLPPGCRISLRDDLPKSVNARRKGLVPVLRQLRQDGKRATLRADKLYTDDGVFSYSLERQEIIRRPDHNMLEQQAGGPDGVTASAAAADNNISSIEMEHETTQQASGVAASTGTGGGASGLQAFGDERASRLRSGKPSSARGVDARSVSPPDRKRQRLNKESIGGDEVDTSSPSQHTHTPAQSHSRSHIPQPHNKKSLSHGAAVQKNR